MEFIQSQYVGNISIEGDEYTVDSTKTVKPLTYKHDIDDLIIMESKCPSVANVLSKASNKGVAGNRTVSTSDMQCIMSNKKIKGNRGEEIVLRVEKDKLIAVNRHDLAAKVEWLSKNTDGLGYDIESYETDLDGKNERKIYIEVKATLQNELTPFFISRNELEVSKNKGNDFYLYRVFMIL
jgi:hypothetical protein